MRKSDPGEKFPWEGLAGAGLGAWVAPAAVNDGPVLKSGDEGQPVRALQSMLALIGYAVTLSGVYDALTVAVVTAFQRHWRQALVDGICDRSTLQTLHALVRTVRSEGAV
jgi:N-acetylmuramoyl-L-alanine amidase